MPEDLAYFDTSVVVKRYVKESGSSSAQDLLRSYQFLSSAITLLEVMSALSRRRGMGDLKERDFLAIRSRIAKDRTQWELVEPTTLVLSQAEELIQRINVRTLDAIHIASVLTFQAASGMQVPFITSDARQRAAAEELSLDVVWVE